MTRGRAALATLAMLALSGCASLGAKNAQQYFVLEAAPAKAAPVTPGAQVAQVAPNREATLLVAPTSASTFYDTEDIAFSRNRGQRAYYQFSSWTEPPARALDRLLVERLGQSGAFASVVLTTSGVRGTLLLRAHLVEMFHDAASEPGQARIELEVELSQPAARTLVARRVFVTTMPVPSADAAGAVQGFDAATTALLDEVAAWTAEHAATPR